VAVVVVGIYALPVLVLPRLLGESSDVVVAASTLAAAAVFNPARRRIQWAVDRRFNRARFDAERELDVFSTRIGADMNLDAIRMSTGDVVARTLSPSSIGLWTRDSP
jgi:hypothetical protein